jgi:diacylglycerol kinase (ATP)
VAALFIVNPAAGRGRGASALRRLRVALDALNFPAEIIRTDRPGAAEDTAAVAVRRGCAPIIAVGGDGTVHEVVNGLLGGRAVGPPGPGRGPEQSGGPDPARIPAFGVIPTGSGNDFARAMGLRAEVESAVRAILDSPPLRIDVGQFRERFFLNAASVGFDAEVAAVAEKGGSLLRSVGPLLYPLALLRALPRYCLRDLQIELDGKLLKRRALLVAIANGPRYGGGFRICPKADPGDGMLDVCVIGDLSLARAVRLLPRLRAGTHVGAAEVEHYRARAVRISGSEAPVQLDGEPCGMAPASFQVVPAALVLHGAPR